MKKISFILIIIAVVIFIFPKAYITGAVLISEDDTNYQQCLGLTVKVGSKAELKGGINHTGPRNIKDLCFGWVIS